MHNGLPSFIHHSTTCYEIHRRKYNKRNRLKNAIYFETYVDDCIRKILKHQLTQIFNAFNNYHPKLKFTIGTEKNN